MPPGGVEGTSPQRGKSRCVSFHEIGRSENTRQLKLPCETARDGRGRASIARVRGIHGVERSSRAQCSHIAAVHEKSSPPTPRPVTGQKYSYIPPCPMSVRVSSRIRSPQLSWPAVVSPLPTRKLITA